MSGIYDIAMKFANLVLGALEGPVLPWLEEEKERSIAEHIGQIYYSDMDPENPREGDSLRANHVVDAVMWNMRSDVLTEDSYRKASARLFDDISCLDSSPFIVVDEDDVECFVTFTEECRRFCEARGRDCGFKEKITVVPDEGFVQG